MRQKQKKIAVAGNQAPDMWLVQPVQVFSGQFLPDLKHTTNSLTSVLYVISDIVIPLVWITSLKTQSLHSEVSLSFNLRNMIWWGVASLPKGKCRGLCGSAVCKIYTGKEALHQVLTISAERYKSCFSQGKRSTYSLRFDCMFVLWK